MPKWGVSEVSRPFKLYVPELAHNVHKAHARTQALCGKRKFGIEEHLQ